MFLAEWSSVVRVRANTQACAVKIQKYNMISSITGLHADEFALFQSMRESCGPRNIGVVPARIKAFATLGFGAAAGAGACTGCLGGAVAAVVKAEGAERPGETDGETLEGVFLLLCAE